MKSAALIVTTGLPRVSGVAALTPAVGTIPAGQRMIAALQRAGVSLIVLVVGPEDKKLERPFSQPGVVFLRCKENAGLWDGVREGLRFLREQYQQVFLVPGDMPLFLPTTLEALLNTRGPMAIPVCRYVNGYPLLLRREGVEALLADRRSATLEEAIENCPLEKDLVKVLDSGILLHGEDMTHRAEIIRLQDRQLTRTVLDISLHSAGPLVDQRLSMLLRLVEQTGSVRDACSLMQISYSSAWHMLNHVEAVLGYPLVQRSRGGSVGSGSILTEKGREIMAAYDQLSEELHRKAAVLFDQLLRELPE